MPGARQTAREVSGLDAGKDCGRVQVDDQPTVDRGFRAGFQAGEFDEDVCATGVKDRVVNETPLEVVDETPLEKE